jgi:hypothetical protein
MVKTANGYVPIDVNADMPTAGEKANQDAKNAKAQLDAKSKIPPEEATGGSNKGGAPSGDAKAAQADGETPVEPDGDAIKLTKGNADQPRDERGRWGAVSGQGKDLVTVYHGSSPANIKSIQSSGVIEASSASGLETGVWVTQDASLAAEYGRTSSLEQPAKPLELKVPKASLHLDPQITRGLTHGSKAYNALVETAVKSGKGLFLIRGDVKITNKIAGGAFEKDASTFQRSSSSYDPRYGSLEKRRRALRKATSPRAEGYGTTNNRSTSAERIHEDTE